jgi:hypothetical protein
MVKQSKKAAEAYASLLPCSLLCPEDGGSMFLRNVDVSVCLVIDILIGSGGGGDIRYATACRPDGE